MIFKNDNKVDDECCIINVDTTYEHYKGPFELVIIDRYKYKFKGFNQLASNFICLPLRRLMPHFQDELAKIHWGLFSPITSIPPLGVYGGTRIV